MADDTYAIQQNTFVYLGQNCENYSSCLFKLPNVTVTTSQALRIIECVYTVSQGREVLICAIRISCLRKNTDGVTYMVP